jgi:uncharacterized metal-binding protein YceD (DUF177 family)
VKISYDELKALPYGRLDFTFNENLAGLDAVKPVVGELQAGLSAAGMRLNGTVKTLLKLSCHRCLKPYFQALTVDIDERFVNLVEYADYAGAETKERELKSDDFFEYLPEDGVLDISDVVYQAVTLATPTYCHCGEECPGVPEKEARTGAGSGVSSGAVAPSSDADLERLDENSIDPRWKNLKTLFPKSKSGEES